VRRVVFLLLATSLVSLSSAGARANGVEVPPVAPRRAVRLEVLGPADEAAQLRSALDELFGRIAIELEPSTGDDASHPASTAGAGVVARVDLREPGVALVSLGRASDALGEPRTVSQRGSRAVLLEETALVVYAGSESLLSEPLGPPPAPPPIAPETPIPPPARPLPAPRSPHIDRGSRSAPASNASTPWLLEGAMLVGARAYAGNASTVSGFGLGAHGHVGESHWLPGAWVLGEFHFPFSETEQGVALSTSVWSLRLEPSVELVRQGGFRLEASAGGGADLFVVVPVSAPPGAQLGRHRRDVSGVVSALVAGSLATSSSSRLVLAATLDCDLAPRHYLVAQGGSRWPLFEPWRFRPGLSVGFLFQMAGEARGP
jgi:hypothetical protein